MLFSNDGAGPRCELKAGATPDRTVWLDLVNPTDEERSAAERITKLRVPALAELTDIANSSRVYNEGGVLYFSMPYVTRKGHHHAGATVIGFVLSEAHLLTVRYEDLPSFDTFSERFGHDHQGSSAEAFTGLLECMVDRLADVLERIAAELDRLSKATFASAGNDGLSKPSRADKELRAILGSIGLCGDTLGNLRDAVLGLARILGFALQCEVSWLPHALLPRLTTLRQDVASLNDYDQQLANKVQFLLDAVLGFINIEQNNGVKVLTVVSVVGIPPTFVVGLYGMNFKNMPEYDWAYGYQFGWAMILLSVAIPLVWFRIKRWI